MGTSYREARRAVEAVPEEHRFMLDTDAGRAIAQLYGGHIGFAEAERQVRASGWWQITNLRLLHKIRVVT